MIFAAIILVTLLVSLTAFKVGWEFCQDHHRNVLIPILNKCEAEMKSLDDGTSESDRDAWRYRAAMLSLGQARMLAKEWSYTASAAAFKRKASRP